MNSDYKARLEATKQKIKEQKERAEQRKIEDHQKLMKSLEWKYFRVFMWFTVVLSILVTLDTTIKGKAEKLPRRDVNFISGNLLIYDRWYLPATGQLQGFQQQSFKMIKTPIFNEAKMVCWTSEVWQADDEAEPIFEERCTGQRISIYEWFPWLSIALLIPLLVFLFKRPTPWFKFGRYFCYLIVYPGSVFLFAFLLL